MNSTLEQLPDSRAVAAELAKNTAKARHLRALWQLLRRLELERERDASNSDTRSEPCES